MFGFCNDIAYFLDRCIPNAVNLDHCTLWTSICKRNIGWWTPAFQVSCFNCLLACSCYQHHELNKFHFDFVGVAIFDSFDFLLGQPAYIDPAGWKVLKISGKYSVRLLVKILQSKYWSRQSLYNTSTKPCIWAIFRNLDCITDWISIAQLLK